MLVTKTDVHVLAKTINATLRGLTHKISVISKINDLRMNVIIQQAVTLCWGFADMDDCRIKLMQNITSINALKESGNRKESAGDKTIPALLSKIAFGIIVEPSSLQN